MNSVDEENGRAFAALGEGDSPVTPIEAALFSANEVGELVDALTGKGVVSGGDAKQGAPGEEDFSPRSFGRFGSFAFVVVLHHTSKLAAVFMRKRGRHSQRYS